jgi:hypothetical protein
MDDKIPGKLKPEIPPAASEFSESQSLRIDEKVENLFAYLQRTTQRIASKLGLSVPCPTCGASRGERCITSLGAVCAEGHVSRQRAASQER